jgi:hypothetical protein
MSRRRIDGAKRRLAAKLPPNARSATVLLKISRVKISHWVYSGAEAGERSGSSEFNTIP